MNFLYPEWFYALIIIPLILIGTLVMHSNRTARWKRFVGDRHEKKLVTTGSKPRSWISFGISLIALACIILAMTRPYHGQTTYRDKIKTRNIIVAIDCSLSMLCEDAGAGNMSRLNSAKTVANNLVDAFPDDHIGVMAFAGSANLISSITIDHPSVKEAINQIDINSAHTRGSDLTNSVIYGIETLKKAGKSANALILITDGAEDESELNELIKFAQKAQVQIFSIGVGTQAGGTIPVQNAIGQSEPHRDQYGREVITKLDDSALRQLATATSGSYSHATNANSMITEAVQSMDQFEQEGRIREVPKELYQWMLAPGILLLITSVMLRTRWQKREQAHSITNSAATTAVILSLFYLAPNTAEAQQDETFTAKAKVMLFTKPADIREGYQALEKGDYAKAIPHLQSAIQQSQGEEHAQLSLALAQAYYRNKQYSEAAKAYSDAMISTHPAQQVDAQYNMGNALFRDATKDFDLPDGMSFEEYLEKAVRGDKEVPALSNLSSIKTQLKNAIDQYSDTLASKQDHAAADKNKRVVEKLLEDIENIQEQIKKEQEQKKKEEKEQAKKEQPKPDPKEKEPKQDPKSKDKKKEKQDPKKAGEEKTEDENPGNKPDPNASKKKEDSGKNGTKSGQQGDSESKDKPKDADEAKKPGQPKQAGKDPSSKDVNSKGEPRKPNNNNNNNSKPTDYEFSSEKEALEFMKRASDLRKKPVKRINRWRNSDKDW